MQVTLNGNSIDIQESLSLLQFLSQNGYTDKLIAIEVNAEIIPKSDYSSYFIQINDNIEIINAVGGG